ncbi:MAG: hypothetical protein WC421_04715 [Elusimicrobiales bacterium]
MEFEAEGDRNFIQTQKEAFLELAKTAPSRTEQYPARQHTGNTQWNNLIDTSGGIPFLKAKPAQLTAANAALLILAAWAETITDSPMEALKLAKAMKKSGYTKGRLDRILADEIAHRLALSAGTKRARNYTLSPEGLARATAIASGLK